MGQAPVEQNFDYVKQLPHRQVVWGADLLDVNVGHPQIDEISIMPKVLEAVMSAVDVPLCIAHLYHISVSNGKTLNRSN